MKIYRVLLVATAVLACTGTGRSEEGDQSPTPPPGSSSIRGCVRDAQGGPIAKAVVKAGLTTMDGGFKYASLTTETDANGIYSFANLPSWSVTLTVSGAGYNTLRRKSIALSDNQHLTGIDFVLTSSLSISGLVTDESGKPLQGVTIGAKPEGEKDTPSPLVAQAWVDARSGDDGRYTLTSFGEGLYTLETRSKYYIPEKATKVAAGSKDVNFTLRGGGGIRGNVTDKVSGQAVAEARVSATPEKTASRGAAAKTDASGAYEILSLDTGPYEITVKATGYMDDRRSGIQVRAGEEATVVDVPLIPNPRIRGTVTLEGGAPAAGARIRLIPGGDSLFSSLAISMSEGFGSPAATSDAQGRYEITKGDAGKKYKVMASLSGYIPAASESFQLVSGRDQNGVDLILKKGLAISGVVTDEQRTPISGATVKAKEDRKSSSVSIAAVSVGGGRASAKTDAEGHFILEGIGPGTYHIEASATGYAQEKIDNITLAESAPTPKPLAIVLRAGITIAGKVTDDGGKALPDVRVSAYGRGEKGSVRQSSKSDEDGRYEIGSLPPGSYKVTARLKGYTEGKAKDVSPPAENIDFTLTGGGRIAGRVVDKSSGQPIVNFRYKDDKSPYTKTMFKGGKKSTSSDGTFETALLPPGDYAIHVRAEGYAPAVVEDITVETGKTAQTEIRLGSAGTLTGKVVADKTSQPVPGTRIELLSVTEGDPFGLSTFMLSLFSETDLLSEPVVTQEDGTFKIGNLPEGKFKIKATHPDFAEQTLPAEIKKEGDEVKVEIKLKKGRALSGKVNDAATSAPIAGAKIVLSADTEGQPFTRFMPLSEKKAVGTCVSDAGGQWRIEDVASGEYQLQAARDGYAPSETRQVSVASDADVPAIDLTLSTGARISGTVRDGSGAISPTSHVTAVGPGELTEAEADSSGRYAIEHLSPGTYQIIASYDRGEASAFKTISLGAGDDVAVDLTVGGAYFVSGKISSAGRPVENAQVILVREEASESAAAGGESGKDGSYRVKGLPAGSYTLAVSYKVGNARAAYRQPMPIVIAGNVADHDITLPTGAITGTVLDAQGRPVKEAWVQKVKEGTEQSPDPFPISTTAGLSSVKTDQGGKFAFLSLGEGSYTIKAQKSAAGVARESVTLSGNDSRADITLTLKPGSSLTLRLLSAQTKQPIERAAVRLSGKNGVLFKNEMLRPRKGEISISDLMPGTYRLEVGAEGYSSVVREGIAVGPEAKKPIEFSLEKATPLLVTVQNEQKKPVAGALIELHDAAGKAFAPLLCSKSGIEDTVVTNARGEAKITCLPPGTYSIRARASGCQPSEAKASLKKGEAGTVALVLKKK